MKHINGIWLIGIDHGYGNIKTAHLCFPTGVVVSNTEPTFKQDLLVYEGRYYQIGVGHKEYAAKKIMDEDYYVLTMAAIARELARERITEATVHLAVGLPLSWLGKQKAEFQQYLLKNETVAFSFRGIEYRIRIIGAEVFPQGYAAVAERIGEFKGTNLLCDIGNGTMNILRITDRRPDPRQMFTEKYGVNQCVLAMREDLLREHQAQVDEATIHRFLRNGTADIDPDIEKTMTAAAQQYTDKVFRCLRERGYDPRLMKLYVVGGGDCLIRHFSRHDPKRVTILDDICATAKGYEYMAEVALRKAGRK